MTYKSSMKEEVCSAINDQLVVGIVEHVAMSVYIGFKAGKKTCSYPLPDLELYYLIVC